MTRYFKYAAAVEQNLRQNSRHQFAQNHALCAYQKNAIYTFIPKNACTTLRLSLAISNGCILDAKQINWIHDNNETFKATLSELAKAEYSFVVLRCPFSRLASTFLDKIVSRDRVAWKFYDFIGRATPLDEITFENFVDAITKRAQLRNLDIHWRPQVDFLVYAEYDDYFSLEHFQDAVQVLKQKIDLDVFDARELTLHGTSHLQKVDSRSFATTPAHELLAMRRSGLIPSYRSLYEKKLIDAVASAYGDDIALYKEKCDPRDLLFR
jgi:hypothetical protein